MDAIDDRELVGRQWYGISAVASNKIHLAEDILTGADTTG